MGTPQTRRAKRVARTAGAISLILFPLLLMLAFALHYSSLSEFFVFKLRYVPNSAREFMDTLTGPQGARLYTIPHLIAYLSVPFLIASALSLAHVLFKRRPWFALVGASLTCIGAIYLGGVFGAWLSFAAIGNVKAGQIEGAIPALEALTVMQGPLLLTSVLSALALMGLMVLAAGLFLSRTVPKWSAALIFIGSLIILVFTDLDNWMFIGAFMILLGVAPICWMLLRNNRTELERRAGSRPPMGSETGHIRLQGTGPKGEG